MSDREPFTFRAGGRGDARLLAVLLALVLIGSTATVLAAPTASPQPAELSGSPTPGSDGIMLSISPADSTPIAVGRFGYAIAWGPGSDLTVAAPDSTSGYEVRLLRVELRPGAGLALADSTNWNVQVSDGAVNLLQDGQDRPIPIESDSNTGGDFGGSGGGQGAGPSTVAWTVSNDAGAPATVTLAALVPSDAPALPSSGGVSVSTIGRLPVAGLVAGQLVGIGLRVGGASPVPLELDDLAVGGAFTLPLPGSVPAALIYADDDGISISGAAEPVTLAAGDVVTFADATGLSVTGSLDRITDTPRRYIAVTVQPVIIDVAARQAATSGTPAATPAPVVPPLDAIRYAGGPVACDVAPRTAEEIERLANTILATPTLYTDPYSRSALSSVGTGQPADGATVAGILDTLAMGSVCGQAQDVARALSLFSDTYAPLVIVSVPTGDGGLSNLATPAPVLTAQPEAIAVSNVEVFTDGRVGAFVFTNGTVSYGTFIRNGDGRWLIDASDSRPEVAGQLPG